MITAEWFFSDFSELNRRGRSPCRHPLPQTLPSSPQQQQEQQLQELRQQQEQLHRHHRPETQVCRNQQQSTPPKTCLCRKQSPASASPCQPPLRQKRGFSPHSRR